LAVFAFCSFAAFLRRALKCFTTSPILDPSL
jgi:hypothetical protein